MKKILPLLFFLLSLYTFYLILNTTSVLAQIRPPFGGGLGSKVSAKVGDFYLNLSGYVSPFSSIILTSDGVFIRATTADQYGNFSISEVLIKSGFSLSQNELGLILVGFFGAFLTAIVAVKFLLSFVQKHTFIPFAVYRIILALLFLSFGP